MGLDVDSRGIFRVERSAQREGYHQFPDICRKVFTRAENKTAFAKSPVSLSTTLDLDAAEDVWRSGCASTSCALGRRPDVDAARALQTHTGTRRAVFFHVPPLETEADMAVGVRVTQELIRALVQVM